MTAVTLGLLSGERRRRPKVRVPAESKGRGHHSDYSVTLATESDSLVQDFGIAAEPPLPQAVAEQRDVGASGLIFFWQKDPPYLRLRAEHRKKTVGDAQAHYLLRIACAGQVKRSATK